MLIEKIIEDRIAIKDVSLLVGQTETGILIAESSQNVAVKKGKVVAAGPDCDQVKVGDVAVFLGNRGIQVRVLEDVYLIIREGDIEFIADPEELAKLPVAPPQQ